MHQIETFESKPQNIKQAPPLLFVHGACLGAWCWTDGFLDFFGNAGFYAVALNLRGHGKSFSAKPLQQLGIDDYVEDVAAVASQMPRPPVVIGHSMGGLIAQRFAARHPTAGVVLMCPAPFAGMQSQAARLFGTHPWQFLLASLTQDMTHIYRDNQRVRSILFSPTTPEETVTRCRSQVQKEPWKTCQEMYPPLRTPYAIPSRMLVLGGEMDGTVPPPAIDETARAYGAPCHIFKGLGHNLMAEPDWQTVAAFIETWLKQAPTS